MFIDTHCHFNIMTGKAPEALLTQEDLFSIATMVEQAQLHNVSQFVCVGTSLAESKNVVKIAEQHASVAATVGIHPCDVSILWQQELAELEQMILAQRTRIVGIGETGLDYYHQPYDKNLQAEAFRGHIELAIRYDLPLVVHIRDAGDDALSILEEYRGRVHGVLHCFSLDTAAAQRVVGWGGWYLGIGGTVTYPRNNELRDAVASVGLNHIVLETDAPFLPPQSMRGKRNTPAALGEIAEKIAQVVGVSIAVVAEQTTANSQHLFSL